MADSSLVMPFASGTILSKTAPPDDKAVAARSAFLFEYLLTQHLFPIFKLPDFLLSPPSISACSSSRVFSFGFVMVGCSFLLIGIEKGQSIFSTVLSDWLCNCKMLFFIKLLNISVIFKLTIFKSLL